MIWGISPAVLFRQGKLRPHRFRESHQSLPQVDGFFCLVKHDWAQVPLGQQGEVVTVHGQFIDQGLGLVL
nr:hypothetical protein [uncultured Desulfobulbus sp.]